MNVVPITPQQPARPTWIEVMDRGSELAEVIANTDFVPRGLRGNQPAILAAILYGHEVGLEPMQSLAKIAVIEGRPSLSSEAQRALIYAAGHELWVEESTNSRATVAGRRRDSKITQRVTWTLDDAKKARIAGKLNWQTYPRQMLVSRATAELARQVFADVIGGMAATEELEDVIEPADAPTVEQIEPEAKTRRRRRPAAAPPPQPSPEPEAEPDPASDAQLRRMFALFREQGIEDRASRLAYTEQVLGRTITSSKELTSLDASQVIDALQPDPPVFRVPDGVELPPDQQAVVDEITRSLEATEEPPLPGE
jgi:hypothetical protein